MSDVTSFITKNKFMIYSYIVLSSHYLNGIFFYKEKQREDSLETMILS
jgi:hypothetical protein